MLNLATHNLTEILTYGMDADCRAALQAIADAAPRPLMLSDLYDTIAIYCDGEDEE